MNRLRRLGLPTIISVLGLAACSIHQGSGWAERVNVPLAASVTLTGTPKSDCGKHGCAIGFSVVVTNEGSQGVYARDCWARALDRQGKVVSQSQFGIGIGPGEYTEPGTPWHSREHWTTRISPRTRARITSLDATCLAYMWHGSIPI